MAYIIDGKKIAAKHREQIKQEANEFKNLGINPTLAVVLV